MAEVNRHEVETPTGTDSREIETTGGTKENHGIFCPGPGCPHYSRATKYPRKCFYEPQCWRGWLDLLIQIFALRLRRFKTGKNQ